MKAGHVVLTLAGLVVAGGITYALMRDGASIDVQPATADSAASTRRVVHVDELAAHPEEFKGEFVLRAVVAGVKESEGVLSVIDSREYESCGVLTCAENYLPVKVGGKLPQPKTVVELTGLVVKNDKGLLFEASRLDVVP